MNYVYVPVCDSVELVSQQVAIIWVFPQTFTMLQPYWGCPMNTVTVCKPWSRTQYIVLFYTSGCSCIHNTQCTVNVTCVENENSATIQQGKVSCSNFASRNLHCKSILSHWIPLLSSKSWVLSSYGNIFV